jgi:hypothetical protein
MTLEVFSCIATTRDVEPGTEQADASGVHVRGRVFTDVVESSDLRFSGINRVSVEVDIDPKTGKGELRGSFTLRPSGREGAWEGEMVGEIVEGLVIARGLARGTGSLAPAVMRIEFKQLKSHPGTAPVAEPKAFFEMHGLSL